MGLASRRQPSCDCCCCSSPPASPVRIPSPPSQLCLDRDVRAAVHSTTLPFMPPPEPDPDPAAMHATFAQLIYSTTSAFTKHLLLPLSSSSSSLVLAPTATDQLDEALYCFLAAHFFRCRWRCHRTILGRHLRLVRVAVSVYASHGALCASRKVMPIFLPC